MMLPSRLGCSLSLKTPNMGNPGYNSLLGAGLLLCLDAPRSSGSVRRRARVYQYACPHQHAHAYTHALLHQYAHTYTHADGHTDADADPGTRPARSLYVSVSAGAHGLHLVGLGERP